MLGVCACVCTCVCSTAYGDQRTTFRNWFSSLPPRTDPGIEFRLSVCDRCLYPLSYPTCLLTFWGINFATLTREELPLHPTCFDVGFSVFWQDSLALACSSLEWALSLRHLAFLCWWWRSDTGPCGAVGWSWAEPWAFAVSPSCAGPQFPSLLRH